MDKQKILDFWKRGRWKTFKKSDWAVIGLAGVLLLVIAMPMDGKKSETNVKEQKQEADAGMNMQQAGNDSESEYNDYVDALEMRLEDVLSKMEGVGKVEVMITIADTGEMVVEKDRDSTQTATTETDSAGGRRDVSETRTEEETIYVKKDNESYPYIQKEKMPTIEGVVVVAEGGNNPTVISDISESVKALLPVEVHRIKVVKMCSKEE